MVEFSYYFGRLHDAELDYAVVCKNPLTWSQHGVEVKIRFGQFASLLLPRNTAFLLTAVSNE